ncbi:hypothetical protein ANN_10771 [Periplaneta americana]|uniref:Uncharacterized protein n=1 Tax=Periplaneta americana TaxID=6978 RepID=A0ABQ8T384_PERAM|nr:hypothetical protein ANN_10771 [Periplaneta americana]
MLSKEERIYIILHSGGLRHINVAAVWTNSSLDIGLVGVDQLNARYEHIPNLSAEQSDGITVFRISPMESLMLHRCRTGAIRLQSWWQSPSAAISESDWFLYRAGISRRMTSCTVVSWRNAINLVDKFRATECTERKKSVRLPTKVTGDAVEDAKERVQQGRNKSVKKLAVDIGDLKLKFLDDIDKRNRSSVKEIVGLPTDVPDAILYAPRNLRGLGVFKAQWEAFLQHLSVCKLLVKEDNP